LSEKSTKRTLPYQLLPFKESFQFTPKRAPAPEETVVKIALEDCSEKPKMTSKPQRTK